MTIPSIPDPIQRQEDEDSREQDIAAAALELFEHLVRRGCAHEDAAGAADLLVQDLARQRKAARLAAQRAEVAA